MRKYKIVYTQDSGKAERTIECEFMTMPTNSDLTITFWQLMDMPQQPEPILVINPNEIAEIERVRDTKVENVFQSGTPGAEDPLSAAAFGLDDEAEHHEPHGPVGNPTHGPDGDVLKGE